MLNDSAIRERIGLGAGVAVVFNLRARHATPEMVHGVCRALPEAALVLNHTLEEAERNVRQLARHVPSLRLIVSAGGDGSVVSLLNAWVKTGTPLPSLALMPLGTGNAWAHATHAPSAADFLRMLPKLRWPLPLRRVPLLDVNGTLCPFAGFGWDAKLLHDYARHRATAEELPGLLREGLGGYLAAALRFTVPEGLVSRPTRTIITSCEPWSLVTRGGCIESREPGTLWDGRFGVVAFGTTTQYGFRFKAIPLAESVTNAFNLRVYDAPLWRAVGDLARLWRGQHPLRGVHDFFARSVRISLQPPTPLQIAGDECGALASVDVKLAAVEVEVIDWRRVGRLR